jgi:nucleoside 2-deoxyribosyltransferase-like protein
VKHRKPAVYCAGPWVFLPRPEEISSQLSRLCDAAGLVAVLPFEDTPDQRRADATTIYNENIARIAMRTQSSRTTSDPVVTFRLGVEYKQAIDRWRCTERDKPSRSEAIRWLIGQGLEVELKKREKRDRAPALSPKEGPA